jgi:hypothetical protein
MLKAATILTALGAATIASADTLARHGESR